MRSKEPTPEQIKEWHDKAVEFADTIERHLCSHRSGLIQGYKSALKQSFAELTALKERNEQLEKEKEVFEKGFDALKEVVSKATARLAELEQGNREAAEKGRPNNVHQCTLPNCDCEIVSGGEGTSFAICKFTKDKKKNV